MIYLSGVVRPDLDAMVTPRMRQSPPPGRRWAADTGRYASPEEYDDARYLAWLERMTPHRDRCLFATAPDVWSDAAETLRLSAPMFAPIRALGYRVALVAQDGVEALPIPWDEFGCLFVGGTDSWRRSEAMFGLAAEARDRGKWLHLGRVNGYGRFATAAAAGFDSADGTYLRFDPDYPVGEWSGRVMQTPGLWSGAAGANALHSATSIAPERERRD